LVPEELRKPGIKGERYGEREGKGQGKGTS
jgi:hypothetical protein